MTTSPFPNIPIDLSSLHVYDPSHIYLGKTFQGWEREQDCQHRGPRSPVTTGSLPDGRHRFQVLQCRLIVTGDRPRPPNMSSQLDWVGKLIELGVESIWTHSSVLKIISVNRDWKGDARERRGESRAKTHRLWGRKQYWNPEIKTKLIIQHHLRIASLMILQTFFGTTHPNLAFDSHDSHSLEAVSHPSSSQVHRVSFHLYSYLFSMMSHCVSFLLLIFSLIYHLICHASYQCCYEGQKLSGTFSLTHSEELLMWI